MSVKLADTAGFCMGVKRAVDMVLELAQRKGNETVYTYGPLIHNPQTVDLLKKRGIIPIASLDEIDTAGPGTLIIIRAHGISPQERRQIKDRGFRILDATCPRVGRVQAIIKKHAARDFTVLIVGDEEHPEVNGLLGYTAGRGMVVNSPSHIDRLPDLERVCVVAQTTQSPEAYQDIVARIRERFPQAAVFDTICDSTENRQREVRLLARDMDAMVIVGGRNSANTQRLAALAAQQGTPTFHVETAEELDPEALRGAARIGVSAGASTPNWIIDQVVDTINAGQEDPAGRGRFLFRFWGWMVRTDLYSALGAASLTLTAMLLQGLPIRPAPLLLAALFVYAMHTINRFVNARTATVVGSFRDASYRRHVTAYIVTAHLTLLAALIIGWMAGSTTFLLLSIMSLLGILYNARLLPPSWRFRSLRDLPGSKNISMALAWATVTTVIPRTAYDPGLDAALAVAFAFVSGLVFVRSAMSDILDIQSDMLIGRETIPVLMGRDRTKRLLNGIALILSLVLALAWPSGWSPSLALALIPTLFYLWICLKVYDRKPGLSGALMEGVLGTSYLAAGICALLWAWCVALMKV